MRSHTHSTSKHINKHRPGSGIQPEDSLMDILRGALRVEAAALREKLADIDMLMDSISGITVTQAPGEVEASDKVKAYLGRRASSDKDVVCSQANRDEFEVFVHEHGGSKVCKTVKLIDYLTMKSAIEAVLVCNQASIKIQSLTRA